jgi:flavin-dependent dehydrogenase
MPEHCVDACVIGGGPAGSTTASRLAALGFSVTLLEAGAATRPRLSASLPADILPLLQHIGARDVVEAVPWRRSTRSVVWWAGERPSFRELPAPVCHVDRATFDRLLLDHAAACGATVLEPARAAQVRRRAHGGWDITVTSPLGHSDVHLGSSDAVTIPTAIDARFVIDASGGSNVLAGRRSAIAPPLLALYAEWTMAEPALTHGYVEAGDDGWCWCGPLTNDRAIVAVFTDPGRVRAHVRSRLGATGALDAAYGELLGEFELFRGSPATRCGPVMACAAGSQSAEDVAGLDFVRAGDAGVRLDPLSSQGVRSAVVSGIQAAAVINTLARHPEHGEAALAFYRERQREHAARHARKTAGFYRERWSVCPRPFWEQRAGVHDRQDSEAAANAPSSSHAAALDAGWTIGLSPRARIASTPAMCGDVIRPVPAVHHDAWERPVAFVDGVDVAPLLPLIRSGQHATEIADTWSAHVPRDVAWRTLQWLWQHDVLVRTCCPQGAV